jgi:hypothetical protein
MEYGDAVALSLYDSQGNSCRTNTILLCFLVIMTAMDGCYVAQQKYNPQQHDMCK